MTDTHNNDNVADLEGELSRLKPVAPSLRLMNGIADALEPGSGATRRNPAMAAILPEGDPKPRFSVTTLLPAAAAVVLIFVGVQLPRTKRSQPVSQQSAPALNSTASVAGQAAAGYKPISAERIRYGDREETFVTLSDGTPARQLRDRYLETVTWRNPQTKASLEWSIPREEIRVIPISAY